MSKVERSRIAEQLQHWNKELGDYGAEGNLFVAIDAAIYGWGEPPKDKTKPKPTTHGKDDWEEYYELHEDDDEPAEFEDEYASFVTDTTADLTEAKLNVLARQKRTDKYLALCKKHERHLRYALKLCELGRGAEGVKYAMQHFEDASEALALAQTLHDLKQIDEALALGEKGLKLGGEKFQLAMAGLRLWNKHMDTASSHWTRGSLRLRNVLRSRCINGSSNWVRPHGTNWRCAS